jgi:hypothetical protein
VINAREPALGAGILVTKHNNGTRTYKFLRGGERTFKDTYCDLHMKPAVVSDLVRDQLIPPPPKAVPMAAKASHADLEAQIAERPDDPEPLPGQRSNGCVTWGTSDSDSLNLDMEGDAVLELRLRMDLAPHRLAAPRRRACYCPAAQLLGADGDRRRGVVRPTRDLLLKSAAHGAAMRFVTDPVGHFRELSNKLKRAKSSN